MSTTSDSKLKLNNGQTENGLDESEKNCVISTCKIDNCLVDDGDRVKEDSELEDIKGKEMADFDELNALPDETKKSKQTCEICANDVPKYTCPACAVRTCCLACVKEHKKRIGCTGERDKAAFVEMKDFSDRHLLNDYRFLEDAERKVYNNKIPRNKNKALSHAPYSFNKRTRLLMSAAHKRGVKMTIMPQGMSKNTQNTSYYVISTDCIKWHIDWIFAASGTLVKHEQVPETTVLCEAAKTFMNAVEFPHLRKSLESYKQNFETCHFLLHVDGLPANRKRYWLLKPLATLSENFKGHCFTEYPSIIVLEQGSALKDYPLLSSDDLPVMNSSNAEHMKHFNLLGREMETQILNPNSGIYNAQKEK